MSTPSQHIRKQDKVPNLFRSSGPEPKVESQSAKPKDVKQAPTADTDTTRLRHLSTVSTNVSIIDANTENTQGSVEIEHVVTNTSVKGPAANVEPSTPRIKPRLDVFKKNVNPPSVRVSLPEIRTRIGTTPQLALCTGLLPKDGDLVDQQEDRLQDLTCDIIARLAWVQAMKQDTIEQDHIRWLGVRMVD
ncbi:hypothetical protein BGW39_004645, partial [Mortierella sp. 14UC]